ncbi:MAG: TerB family tellurite resistance protein [Rubrivivax sp.]|jgi:cytosine/adenosine deaminase-related metal-dependent hydrolase|uniref:TerB family tellurite resistance protein n=1 Tax=Roseateles sp. TaxID=1971397 RepID=UPI00391B035A
MRSYPTNSPQAAARIVALIVIADGDIGHAEALWLDRLAVHEQLGMPQHELYAQLDIFLEDLLSSGQLRWADTCPVDEYTLLKLLSEIQDPELQRRLLRLCVDLAEIDAQVDDGESAVLVAAVEQWGLQHEMLLPQLRH